MGDILRNTASTQIDDYQQRFSGVSGFYDLLFKDLIVDKCNKKAAYETAKKFFGKYTASFVAIDGTEYSKRYKYRGIILWWRIQRSPSPFIAPILKKNGNSSKERQ